MRTSIRIGIDLAKNFFQVHALEREGAPPVTRKLSRGKVLAFFAQAAPCRVGMEACGSSRYWAREIRALGHEVVLIPPAYTKPCVKRGKNDANDAAAICEAMSRPEDAVRADQERGSASRADAAQDSGIAGQAANHDRQCAARASLGIRPDRAQGHPTGSRNRWSSALADETLPEEARQATAMLASHGRWPRRKDRRIWRKKSRGPAGEIRQAGRWMKSLVSARSSHRRSPPSLPIPAIQVGKRFQCGAGHYSEPELERRQGQARRNH